MRGVAAALVALTVLSGCSDDGDEAPAAQPATTVTTAAPVCAPLPAAGTADLTSAGGDFDGDARPDRLVTYRVAAAGAWRVRTELAAGGGAEAELPATAEGVKAVGGARLDVGTGEAAFAVVGRGGAGVNLGLFVLRNCRLERVTTAGRPVDFPIGTGGTTRSGLTCQVPGLVALQAASADGRSYQATSVAYLLVGTLLEEVNRSSASLGADDPALAPYGAFSCGPLRL